MQQSPNVIFIPVFYIGTVYTALHFISYLIKKRKAKKKAFVLS